MGSSRQSTTESIDQTSRTTFDPASAREQELLSQFGSLGDAQRGAIMDRLQSLTSGASPFSLTPEDQAQLDTAFGSARQQLEMGMRDFADFNAGGRGMRMSDTPVAQQALQRYGLGLAELQSQRANAGLNMGLQGNQYRNSTALGLSSAMPSGSVAAFNPLFQERLASGTTRTTGTNNRTTVGTPSLMSQIQQGIGIAGSLGAMGAGFMSGMPGLGAAGAGAGASGMGSLGGSVSGASGGLGLGGTSFGNPYWMNMRVP